MNRATSPRVSAAIVTVSFLLAVHTAFTTTPEKMVDIGDSLGKALQNTLEFGNDSYTDYDANVTYLMHVSFDAKGMTGLYNITTFFMDLIQPKGIDIHGEKSLKFTYCFIILN